MPSFTFIDEPEGLQLSEWLEHRADIQRRLKINPDDVGLQLALRIADETIADLQGSSVSGTAD